MLRSYSGAQGALLKPKGLSVIWGILGVALICFSVCLSHVARHATPSPVSFVLLMGLTSVVYFLSIWLAHRCPVSLSFAYLILIALICRLVLLATPPVFEDDIYRYLWDGKVLSHGMNPFMFPPNAPELTELRDANWEKVNYPQVCTIYPPLAQMLFGATYGMGIRSITTLKAVFSLFDMANILLIAAVLTMLGLPKSWTLAYAWSPLVLKEFTNSGHIEPVMLFFLLLAVYLLFVKKPQKVWAGVSLGTAICIKLIPVFLLPLFGRTGRWKSLCFAALACVAFYLPFVGARMQLFSGSLMYSRYWTFNASLFTLLDPVQTGLIPNVATLPINPLRLLVMLGIIGYALIAARQLESTDRLGTIRAIRNVLAAYLLLMPTVDPWYVCWLLPFLCFSPSRGLLLFTLTAVLSYWYYLGNVLPAWVLWVEYVPVYLLLVWDWGEPIMRRRWAAGTSVVTTDGPGSGI